MRGAASFITQGTRAMSYVLGLATLGLAGAVAFTTRSAGDLLTELIGLFGTTFLFLIAALAVLSALSWSRMIDRRTSGTDVAWWHELGQHAASGIATLALTYTLLGISLGIQSLSEHPLNPETVPDIISELTRHFSRAFMTTVVGLPLSHVLRAVLSLTMRRRADGTGQPRTTSSSPEMPAMPETMAELRRQRA